MQATDNSPLAKAIEYLGAVEVAPGRYAFPHALSNDLPIGWRTANGEWLAEAWADGRDAFEAHLNHATEMPSWWSPSQRFAWRKAFGFADSPNVLGHGGARYASPDEALFHGPNERHERITADLTTGAEVSA